MVLVVPRRSVGADRAVIREAVSAFCESLGYRPRVLVGKRVRVLTGLRIWADS